jgi:putative DNA primase/helicase
VSVDVLHRLKSVRKSGDGWTAKCPAHNDKQSSLSVARRDGKWLLKCHAGCHVVEITKAMGVTVADLFDDKAGGGRGRSTPPATVQPCNRV